MKCIVTGGAGFIGSHVVDLLIENKLDVVIIDNLSTGKEENINKNAKFYRADILDKDYLLTIFEKEKPDYVFHLAAHINLRNSISNPNYDANVNIIGSINLLECCRLTNVKKIIYSSSAAVYGEPKSIPLKEQDEKEPISPYGISKYVVEKYLHFYNLVYGIDYVALRYANVYGPRQDPLGEAGVISIFLNKIINEEECKIFGDGAQTRDYVYVKDVARANLAAMNLMTNSEIKIFNISTNTETTVNFLQLQLSRFAGAESKKVHTPPIKGEPRRLFLDNSLALKKLNWKPESNLEIGLKETVKFFKKK